MTRLNPRTIKLNMLEKRMIWQALYAMRRKAISESDWGKADGCLTIMQKFVV